MKRIAIMLVGLVCVLGLSAAEETGTQAGSKGSIYLQNDLIQVKIWEDYYPYSELKYNDGGTWVENILYIYISLFDGTDGRTYSLSSTLAPYLDLYVGWQEIGSDPYKVVTATFADSYDNPQVFTLTATISMNGDGTKGILSCFDITNLAKNKTMNNVKLYMWGLLYLCDTNNNHQTAYDAGNGVFYAYNNTDDPNLWYGLHSDTGYDMHYYGAFYASGHMPHIEYINGPYEGQNFPDIVESTPGRQRAGWNWDIGAVGAKATVPICVAMATGTSLSDLETALVNIVPVELLDFQAD